MSFSTYSQFQKLESSEKVALVILEASRRLMGWQVHAGSIYKLLSFEHSVISSILQDGTALVEVSGLGSVTAGKFFNDRANETLYLQATDSTNPNGKFLACTFKNFYSTSTSIHQPNDLSSGFDVYWIPIIKATSQFGVELDNKEYLGFAIEGSGSITFINDREYWEPRFDKWYWDNQKIYVYSWNRDLPITEAKLIYRGLTQGRKWNEKQIQFSLKDQLKVLRQPVPLTDLSEVSGATLKPSSVNKKQRIVYGRVRGHIPSNIDEVLPLGNTITGTASTTNGSTSVTGSGTSFLVEVSPDDNLVFGADTTGYTVESVTNDTSLTLTENYGGSTASGKAIRIKGSHSKRYLNRVHLIAGHALKVPATTVTEANKITTFKVADDTDFFVDAEISVGSNITTIIRVSNNVVEVRPALPSIPAPSTAVTLSAIWNVYLNDRKLTLTRDYTFDASTAKLTLDVLAEFNVADTRKVNGSVTFNSTRTVTGTGFEAQFMSGDWIRNNAQSTWYEVLSIDSDTQLTLRIAAAYSATGAAFKKRPDVYGEGVTLSVDAMGATENGTTTGTFIGTGALAAKDILKRAGLTAELTESTFNTASTVAPQVISMAVPEEVSSTKAKTVRDTINRINESIFGSVYQSNEFKLEYQILDPARTTSFTKFIEAEIIKLSQRSDTSKIVKDVVIEYLVKEFDPDSLEMSFVTETQSSEIAEYLAKTDDEFRLRTVLQYEGDAIVFAQRWAFLREMASSIISFTTSLKGSRLQTHDRIKLVHEKLYERFGSVAEKVKLAGLTAIRRDFAKSSIDIDDLGNSYNTTSTVTSNTANIWGSATDDEKQLDGYITDNYGMINNDAGTFGLNRIWNLLLVYIPYAWHVL